MVEKIDFRKKDKALYFPKITPSVIEVPEMKFVTISGSGSTSAPDGEYAAALKLIFSLAYVIKLGRNSNEEHSNYIMPPLETFFYTEEDYSISEDAGDGSLQWKAMLRLPDFVDEELFERAREIVQQRKKLRTAESRFETINEGLCVQCMHIGAFDDKIATNDKLLRFAAENGYATDFGKNRMYHEIYHKLPQKTQPVHMKVVIRQPIREISDSKAE